MDDKFRLEVQMGKVGGYSVVDKFGVNRLITASSDPEDIWEGGGRYTYDADGTAPIVSIASSDNSDTVPIIVQGLDINGVLVEQTITLNGTTRTALDTPLWRVFRLQNEGTVNLVGNVFVYIGTGAVPSIGDSEVRAIISGDNNQTLMCIYTIPKGKTGFLYRGELGMNFTGNASAGIDYADCHYESRRFGKVFRLKKEITLLNNATSTYQDQRSFPDPIPQLTDIRLVVDEVSDDMGIWGTFDILLIDNDKL